MAEHIFGFGKKVTTDASGVLYDSGGEAAPYNANEEDYFIIRRTDFGANSHVFFTINEWSVADAGVASSDYDFIDVYEITGDNENFAQWQWIERIGGSDINSGAGLEPGDIPAKFYVESDWIKLVFRSKYRQDYNTYSGFKIQWHTGGSGDTGGFTDLEGAASTTYTDEINLKENAGDSLATIFDNLTEDGSKPYWDFVPVGQFDANEIRNGINTLNYELTNFNYIRIPGVKLPLSYTQPERGFARMNTGSVGQISREDN